MTLTLGGPFFQKLGTTARPRLPPWTSTSTPEFATMNLLCCLDLKTDGCLFFFLPLELTKTLIVMGLDEKTTAETLKNAFDGAVSARVIVNKKASASKRWVV